MAIDEKLATQVRAALADASHEREVKMFGGIVETLPAKKSGAKSKRKGSKS